MLRSSISSWSRPICLTLELFVAFSPIISIAILEGNHKIARQLLPFTRFLGEKKSNEAGAIVASSVRYIAHAVVARLNKGSWIIMAIANMFFCNTSLFSPHVNLAIWVFFATYTLMQKWKRKRKKAGGYYEKKEVGCFERPNAHPSCWGKIPSDNVPSRLQIH